MQWYSLKIQCKVPWLSNTYKLDNEMQNLQMIGEALRNHRESRDLTLKGVAALIGVDHAGLSRIERGLQGTTTDMLLRLANAYGVTLGDLFAGVTGQPPAAAVSLKAVEVNAAGDVALSEDHRHAFTLGDYALAGSNAAALTVPDDAMTPLLQPGDVVAIDMDDTKIHTTGGVFAIVIGDQVVIRRLFPAPAGIIVQTVNPIYPNTEASAGQLRILGRVKVARRRSGF